MLPPPQAQQPPMGHAPQYYQPPPVQQMTPPCPQCRGPSTFYPAANTFGCDRCQIPVASPMPMMQQPGSDAGTMALKIVGFIVLVIVIVVIRVAIKSGLR